MRLNRFLARGGVSSRRGADGLISAGRVTVNGRVATELGLSVDPESDTVEVDGERVTLPEAPTTIVLNKPTGYVVTMKDPQGRPTVAALVEGVGPAVVPVGRLDAPTEGLLILTNDGDLAHRITHPSFEIDKEYEVKARGVLSPKDVETLEQGVVLDGYRTAPASVEVLSTKRDLTVARITIHEGRKRQVRRMFEAVGHPVRGLRRVRIGPIGLGGLRPGAWRALTPGETRALRRAVGLPEK